MSVGAALTALDRRIAAAVKQRDQASAKWAHSPSAANTVAADEAQAELDRLLDERFKVQQ